MTNTIGQIAEKIALDYLCEQGLGLVMRNYTCPLGEIDLIMRDKEYLVFVEVRSRKNISFGSGIVSITPAKKQKILKTSTHYLLKHRIYDYFPQRFDVISLDGQAYQITWLKDAFGADY